MRMLSLPGDLRIAEMEEEPNSFGYSRTGDNVGVEPLLRRALAIDLNALGPNHPVTMTIKTNLQVLIATEKLLNRSRSEPRDKKSSHNIIVIVLCLVWPDGR
jgi:hypothetical protein